jgi:peroxisomal 3,2-trans-enoyl-CoA isomerase
MQCRGADVSIGGSQPDNESERRFWLKSFVSNNLHITHAFCTFELKSLPPSITLGIRANISIFAPDSHPKILVTALNGPAVGLSAALIAFSDFIYAAPHSFLLTPFSSLGLVAEGNASVGFVRRLGISKANEALIMSKRITCDELVQTGFVNKVIDVGSKDSPKFLEEVLKEVDDRLGDHLNPDSLIQIKALIRKPEMETLHRQGVEEVFGGLNRFLKGVPQEEFRKIASGEKKHKL